MQILLGNERSAGAEILELAQDAARRLVQRQAAAVAELLVVQDRPASRVAGGEEGRPRCFVADGRIFDAHAIAIGVATGRQINSGNETPYGELDLVFDRACVAP